MNRLDNHENNQWHMLMMDQVKCGVLTIHKTPFELQYAADHLAESLCSHNWNNAIVDIRPLTASLTIFEELMIMLKIMSRMPDDIRLGIIASHLDNEDAAYLIPRCFLNKCILLGIFRNQNEAMTWLDEKHDQQPRQKIRTGNAIKIIQKKETQGIAGSSFIIGTSYPLNISNR